jgi:hypothetical protein
LGAATTELAIVPAGLTGTIGQQALLTNLLGGQKLIPSQNNHHLYTSTADKVSCPILLYLYSRLAIFWTL